MPAARYRSRSVIVEAVQWSGENLGEVVAFAGDTAGVDADGRLMIRTLEGVMFADPGDWVIRGTADEVYPCKPGVFADRYDRAEAAGDDRARPFSRLRLDGVLWLLNRAALHPHGYALALHYPDDSTVEAITAGDVEPVGWSLVGDGSEPWQYAGEVEERAALEAFWTLAGQQFDAEALEAQAKRYANMAAAKRAAEPDIFRG